MKCVTIKQPWASLIIEGYKKYEFRSWKTNYRGKIYIHAGLGKAKDIINKVEQYNLDYVAGAIIGEAEVVDCVLVDDIFYNNLRKEDNIVYGNNCVGLYAWKLNNIIKYKEPIYIKGKLGLWEYKN